ncbi:MAG TPA: nitroreductase/quinone reductase family protein, partial [Microlunatus sp.]|nr:nitroreductase/quinone reductase family protein [Microlunatus sp.]
GKVRRVPILRTSYRGADYLVALAGESQWVRNVRAAGGRAVIRRRRARSVHLEELAPAERPEVIAEYLRAGRRRSGAEASAKQARFYFGLDPDPSIDDIRTIVENYPVFRVEYLPRRDRQHSKNGSSMSYLKPPALTRHVINPVVSRLRTGGVATLTIVGRNSGRPRTVPVIPVEVDGIRYLVSPFGESEWVRNLRKAGTGQLGGKTRTESFRATELPMTRRPPIIAAYRKSARRDVDRYFTRLPDPADHPVFQITPTATPPQTSEDG